MTTIINYEKNPLTTTAKVALAALFVLHWIIILVLATYALWAPRKYDKFYMIFFCAMIVVWFWLKSCPISRIERRILYKHSDRMPTYINPSIQFYQPSGFLSLGLMSIISIVYVANVFAVLRRMESPYAINVIFCMVVTFVMAEARYYEAKALMSS